MIDAVGNVQSILVLGGTSDIAMATIERLTSARLNRVVLAGRPSPALEDAATRVRSFGVQNVSTIAFDATDPPRHCDVIDAVFDGGDIDVVVFAVGVAVGVGTVGGELEIERNPAAAVTMAMTNYVGPMNAGLLVAQRIRKQGHGFLAFITSVAGERPRKSTFVYGSTQSAIDSFAVGLGESLRGTGGRVLVIRVGKVATKQLGGTTVATGSRTATATAASAVAVASAIAVGLRRKHSHVVYVPSSLRAKMRGVRHIPTNVFRHLPS